MLLADSQLLFTSQYSKELQVFFRNKFSNAHGLYIGAANGDQADFYALACDAFQAFGASLSWAASTKEATVKSYDFYVLAGGDVAQGWDYLSQPPVQAHLQSAYARGAVFIGISAGAIHLANTISPSGNTLHRFFDWVDLAVAVHEERDLWPTKTHWERHWRTQIALLCIPFAGAMIVHAGEYFQAGKGVELNLRGGNSSVLPWFDPSVIV